MKKSEKNATLKPARGRPRRFDREEALAEAMRLFWRKGFTATSLTDLTDAMKISAPSFYSAFASKEALYAEALHHYIQTHGGKLWDLFDEAKTAREAFTAYLIGSAEFLSASGGSGDPPGCMLALSSVGEEGNAALGEIVRQARRQTLGKLEARLAQAVEEGELSEEKADGKALFFLAVRGGMSLQARDGASREDLEKVAQQALSIWDVE
jgi:AcrR family transcriptional regulator